VTFEPQPFNRKVLQENIKLNNLANITVESLGVSDRNDRLQVRGQSSEGNWSIASDGAFEFPIELIRLDDYVASKGIKRVDVIKLDIEGNELAALRGAEQTLRTFRPCLVFEVNPYWLRKMGASPPELLSYLRSLSYDVRQMTSVPTRRGRTVSPEETESMASEEWTNLVAFPS